MIKRITENDEIDPYQYIIASAIIMGDHMFIGKRHGNAGKQAIEMTGDGKYSCNDDGFLTSKGFFINRKAAYILANKNGQFKRYENFAKSTGLTPKEYNGYDGQELFSEDIFGCYNGIYID